MTPLTITVNNLEMYFSHFIGDIPVYYYFAYYGDRRIEVNYMDHGRKV
jgi:hypothetical protein